MVIFKMHATGKEHGLHLQVTGQCAKQSQNNPKAVTLQANEQENSHYLPGSCTSAEVRIRIKEC